MAKRFTDTNKWDKASFDGLSLKMKLVWLYLCDKCDHAGIWDVNFRQMAFHLGVDISEKELKDAFGRKLIFLSDTKIFMPAFVDFQYGELNPENRAHFSVIQKLKKEGAYKDHNRSSQGRKDKEKDKDTDKDKDKEKEEAILTPSVLFALWNENCGVLPRATALNEKRRSFAKAQIFKYPDESHWLQVLNTWLGSTFCLTKWLPTFDDWLSEDKRTKTIEGKYNNRESGGIEAMDFTEDLKVGAR